VTERDTILVTGSREWTDIETIREWLFPLASKLHRLVHGGAHGADSLAEVVSIRLGFEVQSYPVDIEIDGSWPAAGVRRNERMVRAERHRIRRALAFSWHSEDPSAITRGTNDCVARCIRAGIPVVIVTPGARP
jgi:hypothetical protein